MAQIGNVHPEDLVPWWHASRQLTPQETETIGRIISQQHDTLVAGTEDNLEQWLHSLPPIPPRRADRLEWSFNLEGRHGGDVHAVDSSRRHLRAIREALLEHDALRLLLLFTHRVNNRPPVSPDRQRQLDVMESLTPLWRRELQAIRDAYETRIDDALEKAVQDKAAEVATITRGASS